MNGKSFIAILIVLLLGIVAYKVVFVPTNLVMRSSPDTIFATSSSPVVVKATLMNRLGMPVPFRHLSGKFIINEGADKIAIVKSGGDELVFRTSGQAGRLVIFFYSHSIAFPVEIILNIKGAAVAGLTQG